MADDPQTTAAAVTPAPAGPAQPAANNTTTDDGFERVPRDQYQTLLRNNERVRGMESLYQTATKYGWKTQDDIKTWGEFAQFAKGKNLDPKVLMQAFQDEQEQQKGQSGFDAEAFKKELGEQFVTKDTLAFERAMGKHELLADKANGLEQDALKDLIDEGATPRDRFLIQHAFRAMLADPKFLKSYPEGHPLAEKALMPHDADSIKSVVAHVKKELGMAAGAEVAQIGAEAAKGGKKTPTPAGSSSTSKANNTGDGTRRRPDGKPHPDDVQKAFDEMQAKRRGGTMSSAGG